MYNWRESFYVIQSITDLNGVEKTEHPYEFLQGFVCHVPAIVVGSGMLVYFPDMASIRLYTTAVEKYTYDSTAQLHIVRTLNSIYTFKEYHNPEAGKRAKATLYMMSPISRRYREGNPDPEGHLLSHGRYRTKLYPPDLPEWYVYGYMYKRHGFMSAKGVKHMVYEPCYSSNHLYKDDVLFISYDKEIVPVTDEHGFSWHHGYDLILSGPILPEFVDAAEKYSNYNVDALREELAKKKEWYYEQNNARD